MDTDTDDWCVLPPGSFETFDRTKRMRDLPAILLEPFVCELFLFGSSSVQVYMHSQCSCPMCDAWVWTHKYREMVYGLFPTMSPESIIVEDVDMFLVSLNEKMETYQRTLGVCVVTKNGNVTYDTICMLRKHVGELNEYGEVCIDFNLEGKTLAFNINVY